MIRKKDLEYFLEYQKQELRKEFMQGNGKMIK